VAEYRVVPAANCFPIPERMTLDEALGILNSSEDVCRFGELLHEAWLAKRGTAVGRITVAGMSQDDPAITLETPAAYALLPFTHWSDRRS